MGGTRRRAPRPARRSRTLGASASAAPRLSTAPGPLLRWLDAARGRPQAAPCQLRVGEVRRGDDHVGRVRVAPQSALLHGQVTRAGSDPCGGPGLNAEGSQCPAQHFVPKGSPCLPHLAHVHPDSGPVGQRRPREAVRRRHQPCAISESRQARHCPREVAAAVHLEADGLGLGRACLPLCNRIEQSVCHGCGRGAAGDQRPSVNYPSKVHRPIGIAGAAGTRAG